MLFPDDTRFAARRTENLDLSVDEPDDQEDGSGGGGASGGGTETQQQERTQRNAEAARRRIEAKQRADADRQARDQDRRELSELRTWKTEADKDLQILRKLRSPDGDTRDPLEDLDTLDSDQMKTLLRDMRDRVQKTETAVSTVQAGQFQPRTEPSAREIIANERTAQAEIDFARDRGLSVRKVRGLNGQLVETWVIDSDEDGAWAPDKMNQFIDFMRSSGRRGSGPHGEFTVEDFEEAEFRYDRDGVRNRDRRMGQQDVLSPSGERGGRNGRGSSDTASGIIPISRAIAELQKGNNPFKDENDVMGCLFPQALGVKARVSAPDALRLKSLLREKFPDFAYEVEQEVTRALANPAKAGAFDE